MPTHFLPNRKTVIDKTTELTALDQHEWIGMGRTAAWIKLPAFRQSVELARSHGAEFKVVIFFEGEAHKYVPTWSQIGAQLRYFEHGFIRVLIFDHSDAIIAFPKVVTNLDEDREYFGYHIQNERAVDELRNYFSQIWAESEVLSPNQLTTDRSGVPSASPLA